MFRYVVMVESKSALIRRVSDAPVGEGVRERRVKSHQGADRDMCRLMINMDECSSNIR